MKKYFETHKEKNEFIRNKTGLVVIDYGIKTIMGEKLYWIEYEKGDNK